MGQKVHPESMRVGYIHDWKSNWFTERDFSDYLFEDVAIRSHIINKLSHAGLSNITIRKDANEVEVNIHTARPGIVIGKSGSEVDALRKDLHRMTRKQIKVNILEIKRPELDANLVAQSIAEQLRNRVAFRRAMKRALTSAMRSGAKGCKVQVSGRLGGAEMARTESYSDGRVPLHTMRADIDYGFYEAVTTFGRIGVKCWINKGEIMPEGYSGADLTEMEAPQQSAGNGGDDRGRGRGRGDGGPGGGGRGRGGGRGGGGGGPRGPRGARGAAGRGGGGGGRGGGGGGRRRPRWPWWSRRSRWPWRLRRSRRARRRRRRRPWRRWPRGRRRWPRAPGRWPLDACSQARQAPQGPSRPSCRALARPDQRAVRRVRPEGAGGRLADQSPDRGCPYRDDPQDQAWREGLDQRLPGQELHQEARRDPHGLGQGLAGGLGRGRQARPRDVRAGRRARAARPRGHAPGRPQAADQDQVRSAGGRMTTAKELRDLRDDELADQIKTARREVFGLRFQLATGELENTAGVSSAKRDLARALTVARERGLDTHQIR